MLNAIDGIWEMVRAEMEGDAAPEMVVAKTALELANGTYAVRFAGKISDRGSFELAATGDVNSLLLRGREGPNAGRTIPCIYQRMGDRLRICFGLSGVVPTEFTATAGQQRYLATYRLRPAATRE